MTTRTKTTTQVTIIYNKSEARKAANDVNILKKQKYRVSDFGDIDGKGFYKLEKTQETVLASQNAKDN